jgi:hypothetical protein
VQASLEQQTRHEQGGCDAGVCGPAHFKSAKMATGASATFECEWNP